ncbi:MAG TPA: RHS repeat-associated core domain-containing protein [Terriglobales bacterium]|nr:RHS repeat-associated core domain-containing protein [Terriglobales bacterium]
MHRRQVGCVAFIILVLAAIIPSASAQVATGAPPFSSLGGGPFDAINLANLNVHFSIPVFSRAGRGMPFSYALQYDGSIWTPVQPPDSFGYWSPATNWGWGNAVQSVTGLLTYNHHGTVWGGWQYVDPSGTGHPFSAMTLYTPGGNPGTPNSGTVSAKDGSGYTLYASVNSSGLSATIYTPSGGTIVPPQQDPNTAGTYTVQDSNGNVITANVSSTQTGTQTVITDTLGTTALTIALVTTYNNGVWSQVANYTYAAPNGSPATVQIIYNQHDVRTNFGTSIFEGAINSAWLVSEIDMPDIASNPNDKYTFAYEPTPGDPAHVTGRIASVTLPTGGSISYSYSGGSGSQHGIYADGTTAAFTRTVNDGTNSNNWAYATDDAGHTTVVDPQNNETDLTFSGLYETQRHIYQGRASGGTQLLAMQRCYNNDSSCNATTAVTAPITAIDVYSNVGSITSRAYTSFNSYGLPTETDQYDFTSTTWGNPVKKTIVSYASLGNYIVDRPSNVIVKDGNNNILAQTNYVYDETGLGSLAGTPQHIAVSGSRGNVTTVSQLVQGTTYLSKTFSYLDSGNVLDATDVNGAVTHSFYDTNPAVSCGNSFPQAVGNIALALYTWTSWNCTGAVPSSTTDANSQVTSTTWNDPYFWRPAGVTDPLLNTMNIGYGGATITESNMIFNGGNSIVDSANTRDGLGRPHFSQRRQGATGTAFNTFDSVETDYDSDGRPYLTTVGYVGAGTQSYCSAHGLPSNCTPTGTSTTYDALGRPLLVTAADGLGIVKYTYTNNDVLIETKPAPTTPTVENTKQRQYEYDALGRLTSVCEVVTDTQHLAGSGACGQSNPQNGYLTKYTYDTVTINSVLYTRFTVTQNAQTGGTPQTRTYLSDLLGRMVQEANPETGTVSYTYDSDTTCGTSNGDLVKKVDQAGNVTCNAYDALHRLTSKTYPSGPNAANTPRKYFIYDAATYAGTPMANAKGRLATAVTCPNSGTCNWITWEFFSYSPRGELTDIYSTTPNAAGAYHLTQSYWEHGLPKQLSGLPGLPAVTYGGTTGLDGEGRVTQVTASTGISPVNNVSYNNTDPNTSSEPLGALLSVNLGTTTSGQYDSNSFTYYPNTGRLHTYQFSVNSQTDTGTLIWNANGSLQQLAINDSIPGAVDSQTCNYSHDDLGRIAGVDCGTAWNQTFAYDPFGNITKNGMLTFQPTYNTATNRITTAGFTYDNGGGANSNGNLTNDVYHTYTWDADGKMVSVTSGANTVNLTYDALGRMVEQQRGTSYQQIVYGPGGGKLALMNGQTLAKAFVPLPGGATAVYNASGLQYYRHSDWLGSSRLASTPSRTLYYSGAYAPFGESYKEAGTTDHSFTGQNEDTAPGLEDFMYREYSFPQQGRWISPDPAGMGAVSLTDPQSWNRYAYVSNSPLTSIDPLGLRGCPGPGAFTCSAAEANGSEFGGGFGGFDLLSMYGGGPECRMDGASMPCGVVMAFLRGGGDAVAMCPGGDCSRVRTGSNGQFQYYIPGLRTPVINNPFYDPKKNPNPLMVPEVMGAMTGGWVNLDISNVSFFVNGQQVGTTTIVQIARPVDSQDVRIRQLAHAVVTPSQWDTTFDTQLACSFAVFGAGSIGAGLGEAPLAAGEVTTLAGTTALEEVEIPVAFNKWAARAGGAFSVATFLGYCQ